MKVSHGGAEAIILEETGIGRVVKASFVETVMKIKTSRYFQT